MNYWFPIRLQAPKWLAVGRLIRHVALGMLAVVCFWIGNSPGWAYDLHDNAVTHADAGRQLMYLERPAEAIEEFKAALQLNPYAGMAAQIYNNLGLAYRATGNYIYAYAAFERACRIQPTFSLAFKNLVETYAQAGRLPQAQLYFRERLLENPDNAEAWFMLGYIYKANQNPKAAKACFERFLKLEPDSEMARAARTAL